MKMNDTKCNEIYEFQWDSISVTKFFAPQIQNISVVPHSIKTDSSLIQQDVSKQTVSWLHLHSNMLFFLHFQPIINHWVILKRNGGLNFSQCFPLQYSGSHENWSKLNLFLVMPAVVNGPGQYKGLTGGPSVITLHSEWCCTSHADVTEPTVGLVRQARPVTRQQKVQRDVATFQGS